MPVGMEVTEDTPPDMFTGSMNLKLVLPSGKKIKTSVDRSTPMMDLLVHVTTCHKLSPAAHVLQPYGERGILPYKPSTPIGALDTVMVHVVPKNQLAQNQSNKMALKLISQPFEQTYRIQVSLPRNQLYVLRANGRTTIADIHSEICNEKNLDPAKYSLRHPKEQSTELKGDTTIAEYKSNQLVLVSNRSNPPHQLSTDDIINAIQNINKNNNNNIYAFEPSSRSLSPDSSVSPVAEPAKPLRKKKPPAPKPPVTHLTSQKSSKEKTVESSTGRVICHSRTSSDSSGYHEASLLSESPPSNNSSLPDSLPRRSKLDSKSKAASDTSGRVTQNPALSKSLSDLKVASMEPPISSHSAQTQSSLKSAQSTTSLNTARKKRLAPPPPPTSAPPPMRTVIEERISLNSELSESSVETVKERSRTLEPDRRTAIGETSEKCRTLPPGMTIGSAEQTEKEMGQREDMLPDEEHTPLPVAVAPPVARPRSITGVINIEDWDTDGVTSAGLGAYERSKLDGLDRCRSQSSFHELESRVLDRIDEGVTCEIPKVNKRSQAPPVPRKRTSLIIENDETFEKPVALPRSLHRSNSNSSTTPDEIPDLLPTPHKRRSFTQDSICSRSSCSEEKYYSADSESEDMNATVTELNENIDNIPSESTYKISLPNNEATSKSIALEETPAIKIDNLVKDNSNTKAEEDVKMSIVTAIPICIEDNYEEDIFETVSSNDDPIEKRISDHDDIQVNVNNNEDQPIIDDWNDKENTEELIVSPLKTSEDDKPMIKEFIMKSDRTKCNYDISPKTDYVSFNRQIIRNSYSETNKKQIFEQDSSPSVRGIKKVECSISTVSKQSIDNEPSNVIKANSNRLLDDSKSMIFSSFNNDLNDDFSRMRINLRKNRPVSFGDWKNELDLHSNISVSSRRKSFESFGNFNEVKTMFEQTEKLFFGKRNLSNEMSQASSYFKTNQFGIIDENCVNGMFSKFDLSSPGEEDSGVEITEITEPTESPENDSSPVITEPVEISIDTTQSNTEAKDLKEAQTNNLSEELPKVEWSKYPGINDIGGISDISVNSEDNRAFRPKTLFLDNTDKPVPSVRNLLKSFEGFSSIEQKNKDSCQNLSRTISKQSDSSPTLSEKSINIAPNKTERQVSFNLTDSSRSLSTEEEVFSPLNEDKLCIRSTEGNTNNDLTHGSFRSNYNKSRARLRQVESTGDLESVEKSLTRSRLRMKWPPKSNLSDERDLVMEDEEIDRIFNNATADHGNSLTHPVHAALTEANDSGRDSTDSNEVHRSVNFSSSSVKSVIPSPVAPSHSESPQGKLPEFPRDSNAIVPVGLALPSPVKTVPETLPDSVLDWEYKLPAPPTFRDPPESDNMRTSELSDRYERSSSSSDSRMDVTPRSAVMSELSSIISQRSSSDILTPVVEQIIENTSTLDNFKITTYKPTTSSVNSVNPSIESKTSVRRNNSLVRESNSNNFDGISVNRPLSYQGLTTSNPSVKRSVSHVSLFVRPYDNLRSKTLERSNEHYKDGLANSTTLRKTSSEFNIDSVGKKLETSRMESDGLQTLQVLRSILPQLSQSQGALNSIAETEQVKPESLPVIQKPPSRSEKESKIAVSLGTWGERPKRQVSIKSDRDYVFGQGGATCPRKSSVETPVQKHDISPSLTAPITPYAKTPTTSSMERQESTKSIPEEDVPKIESVDSNGEVQQFDDDKRPKRISNVYKNLETGNTKPLRQILNDVSRVPVVRSVELKSTYKELQVNQTQNRGLDRLRERFESDSRNSKETMVCKTDCETFESTDRIRERFETAIKERYETAGKLVNPRRESIDETINKDTTKFNINPNPSVNKVENPVKYESKVRINQSDNQNQPKNKMISQTKIELNETQTKSQGPLTNRYTSVIGIGGPEDEVVRVRVKTSSVRAPIISNQRQLPTQMDPRQQLLTSIRGFGGLDALKKVRS